MLSNHLLYLPGWISKTRNPKVGDNKPCYQLYSATGVHTLVPEENNHEVIRQLDRAAANHDRYAVCGYVASNVTAQDTFIKTRAVLPVPYMESDVNGQLWM